MGTSYIYGYARVSTQQQDLARQMDMLKQHNCTEILTEKISGVKADRPELNRLKDKVRPGDIIVVESFSRLGRSTKDLIELVEYFESRGVKIISVKENFDTATPQGKLMLTVFQAFSQFERDLIVQRTKEGLESARARGRKGGRPRVMDSRINKALKLYYSKEYSINDIVEMTGVSQATLYRYKNMEAQKTDNPVKTAKITMYLRIENNNKFVRGRKKAKEETEQYLKAHYNLECPVTGDYIFYVPYTTVEGLTEEVYEIIREIDNLAVMRNCFIETVASCVSERLIPCCVCIKRITCYNKLKIYSPEQELTQDLLTILHVFSCRLCGIRKYKDAIKQQLSQGANAGQENQGEAGQDLSDPGTEVSV